MIRIIMLIGNILDHVKGLLFLFFELYIGGKYNIPDSIGYFLFGFSLIFGIIDFVVMMLHHSIKFYVITPLLFKLFNNKLSEFEICKLLHKIPSLIQCINKQTNAMHSIIVNDYPEYFKYLKNVNYTFSRSAVAGFYENINYMAEEHLLKYIKEDRFALGKIKHLKNLSDDNLVIKLIQINYDVVQYLSFISKEVEAFCKLSNINLPY